MRPKIPPTLGAATGQVTHTELLELPHYVKKLIRSFASFGVQCGYLKVRGHTELKFVSLGFSTNLLLEDDKIIVATTIY